ncbi:MAG: isoprenyl transferase [Elusimicrobiaceae bacterium]|nr:isoprenyl transferase [Elusimicrobiaceae bacterium]
MSIDTTNPTPKHVAIIMDGNGRWAAMRNLPRSAGHKEGAQSVRRIIESAPELGIKFITLYAFSTENWSRPKEEIDALMDLLEKTLDEYQKSAEKKNLRIWVSGEREPLPVRILQKIDKLVQSTAHHTGLTVNLALNYGAQQEITHAVNKLLADGKKQISIQDISDHLYQPQLPAPELIIRTSGEQRLSNFLLWQAAYSEFYFTSVLWPDFNKEQLQKALQEYQRRQRRFGGI